MKNIYLVMILSAMVWSPLQSQSPGTIAYDCITNSTNDEYCIDVFTSVEIDNCTDALACSGRIYCWFVDYNSGGFTEIAMESDSILTVDNSIITDAGSYTFKRCYYCPGQSCGQDSCSNEVTLLLNPTPNATISPSDIDACQNGPIDDIIFTGSLGLADYTFGYSIDGNPPTTISTSGQNSVSLTPSAAGTYTLESVVDANGCMNSDVTGQTVVSIFDEMTFSMNVVSLTTICTGETATLTVNVDGGIGPLTYLWQESSVDCNSGFVDIANSNSASYTTPALNTSMYYRVIVSDVAGGCADITSECGEVAVTSNPSAIIEYDDPFCSNDNTAHTPTLTGTMGGEFTATGSLPIDMNTGEITPSMGSAGMYTITYTIDASGGCLAFSTDTDIVINDPPIINPFSYSGPFCRDDGNAKTPSGSNSGGMYSSSTLNVNSSTGAFTPDQNSAGMHTVVYTIPEGNGCDEVMSSTTVRIDEPPTASISYNVTEVCNNSMTPLMPNLTGTPNGSYSATPAGLAINTMTGVVVPSSSSGGNTYTITYTTPALGACAAVSATFNLTVGAAPVSNTGLNYNEPFCGNVGTIQSANLVGTSGGDFSAMPGGLDIDTNTGGIIPEKSTPGMYTVVYTIEAANACPEFNFTDMVTIGVPNVISTYSYPMNAYCADVTISQAPTVNTTNTPVFSSNGLNVDSGTGVFTPSNNSPGNYNITLELVEKDGCMSESQTRTVTINALPEAKISGDLEVCEDGVGTLSTPSNGDYSYNWNSSSNDVSTVDVSTTDPGTFPYSVTVTNTMTSCLNTDNVSVLVYDRPMVVFQNSEEGNIVCQGTDVIITATAFDDSMNIVNNNIVEYNWSGQSNNNVLLINTGSDGSTNVNYSLQIVDNNGCTDNKSGSFYVNNVPFTPIPEIVSGLPEIGSNITIEAQPQFLEPNSKLETIDWNFMPAVEYNCTPAPCEDLTDFSGDTRVENIRGTQIEHKMTWTVVDNYGCSYSNMEELSFTPMGCLLQREGMEDAVICLGDSFSETYSTSVEGVITSLEFFLELPDESMVPIISFSNQPSNVREFDVTIPANLFAAPGSYKVISRLQDANLTCSGDNFAIHRINVFERIDFASVKYSVLQDTLCDSISIETQKSFYINLAKEYEQKVELKYRYIRPGGSVSSTFNVQDEDSLIQIVLENNFLADPSLYGEYQLIIDEITFANSADNPCGLSVADTLSFNVIPCRCSESSFGDKPPGVLMGDFTKLCESDTLQIMHSEESGALNYRYFVSEELLTNSLAFVDDSLDFLFEVEYDKQGQLAFDATSMTLCEDYYIYAIGREEIRNCNIRTNAINVSFFPNPNLEVTFDKTEYCRNQVALVNHKNSVTKENTSNMLTWLEKETYNITRVNDTTSYMYWDADVIDVNNELTLTLTADLSHVVGGNLTCFDQKEYDVEIKSTAPDTARLYRWPGVSDILVLDTEVEDVVCYKWFKLKDGVVEAIGEDSQFLFINESEGDPALIGNSVNPNVTYFVDYYFDGDCDSETCGNRIYFTGDQWSFPRSENVKDIAVYYDIHPNPVQDELTIKVSFGEEAISSIRALNMQGQLMLDQPFYNFDPRIQTIDWPPGPYLIQLVTIDGRLYNTKIIKY